MCKSFWVRRISNSIQKMVSLYRTKVHHYQLVSKLRIYFFFCLFSYCENIRCFPFVIDVDKFSSTVVVHIGHYPYSRLEATI